MKCILLINEYFSDNVGDQAISKGISDIFLSKGYLVKNEGFSHHQNHYINSNYNEVARRNYLKKWLASNIILKSINWTIKNSKRVIYASYNCEGIALIGGGQLILANSSFAIAMLIWVMVLKIFGKKVIILSVGLGEHIGFYEKILYKISFFMSDAIFIRERKGISRLKNEFNVEAEFCPDMAYALTGLNRPQKGFKRCTVCIINYDVHQRYASEMGSPALSREQYWAEWESKIHNYLDQGYIISFAWTTESDKYETISFLDAVTFHFEYSLFDNLLNINEIMKEFSKSDIVIAGRMHALILAKISGCEAVPWLISKKIVVFSTEYLSVNTSILRQQIDYVINILISQFDKEELI